MQKEYENYGRTTKTPRVSQVLVRPKSLRVVQGDVHSLDFHFGKRQELVAADLKTTSDSKVTLDQRPYFQCPVAQPNDSLQILLFDQQDHKLAIGKLPLFLDLGQVSFCSNSSPFFEPMVRS